MRIHTGISLKRKINSTEIIFFKKFPSLPRHSLTSKQETKNIPEKQNLTGKSDRDFKCRSTVTLKEHTLSGIIATSGLGLSVLVLNCKRLLVPNRTFFWFFLWLKNTVAILPSVQLEIFIVFWVWEIIWRDVRLLIKTTVNCRISANDSESASSRLFPI